MQDAPSFALAVRSPRRLSVVWTLRSLPLYVWHDVLGFYIAVNGGTDHFYHNPYVARSRLNIRCLGISDEPCFPG